MATAKAQDSSETPEMSSSSSDREESSYPVESPSRASKEDEEISITDMPSSASSKGQSSSHVESPFVASNDGEEVDIPEMRSLASSKEGSPASDELPPGPSKEDGDEIDILSSKTESPPLISTEYSTSTQTSGLKCSSYICCDTLCTWLESFECLKNKRANCYNSSLFVIGFLGLVLACFILKNHAVVVFWEFLYGSILVMYCSLLTCCSERGRCSGTPSPNFRERKKVSSPAKGAEEEEITKDAVPAAIQADTPEHERGVVIDVHVDPGTSSPRVEIALIG